jgi:hypothetical protein
LPQKQSDLVEVMTKAFEKDLHDENTPEIKRLDDIAIFTEHIGRQLRAVKDKQKCLILQNCIQSALFKCQMSFWQQTTPANPVIVDDTPEPEESHVASKVAKKQPATQASATIPHTPQVTQEPQPVHSKTTSNEETVDLITTIKSYCPTSSRNKISHICICPPEPTIQGTCAPTRSDERQSLPTAKTSSGPVMKKSVATVSRPRVTSQQPPRVTRMKLRKKPGSATLDDEMSQSPPGQICYDEDN